MLEFTDQNFEKEVIKSAQPVLVDFWMPGCGPCLAIGPIIEELSKEFEGEARVGKLNIGEYPEIAKRYGILGVPTIIIFKDGKPIERATGLRPKQVLTDKLNSLL